jgi:2-amino-4-hydroxy-6-hydroxymethyldihydropteridine diphosphokinase
MVLDAIKRLARLPRTAVLQRSSLYRTAPWGLAGQADFVNAVAKLDTILGPHELLEALLAIESELGRLREGERWGPRCIDLDLLTYENVILESERLVLPHPRMHLRAFVLVPLLALEPEFRIPGRGDAAECLAGLDQDEKKSVTTINPTPQEPMK